MFKLFKNAAEQDDLPFAVDTRSVNKIIGYTAFFLPVVLGVLAAFDTVPFMYSISHFYFMPIASDVLVGALAVIGFTLIFMYKYKGDPSAAHPAHNWWNARLANFAGACALGVALFPTGNFGYHYPTMAETDAPQISARLFVTDAHASGTIYAPDTRVGGPTTIDLWQALGMAPCPAKGFCLRANLHMLSAAGMFLILAYFSLCVFTLPQDEKSQKARALGLAAPPVKWWRNLIYRVAGGVILLALLGLGLKIVALEYIYTEEPAKTEFLTLWDSYYATFVLEMLALWAFGISWLVKGRFIRIFNDPPAELPANAAQNDAETSA